MVFCGDAGEQTKNGVQPTSKTNIEGSPARTADSPIGID
jgi:hypothetical protein